MLSLEKVGKWYWRGPRRIDALCDVSLELGPGEFVAIHGMQAGKTTLLRVAAGIADPDSGSVRYRGVALAEMSDRERAQYRRHEVGCAWCRTPETGNRSVLDYVAIPLFADGQPRRDAQRSAYEILERVGIELVQDERLIELSDGERRRVELAQALVRKPKILLADEPVSNADVNYVEGDQILKLLQEVARDTGVGVLITSSEVIGAMRATRIMGLHRGRLIGAGAAPAGEVIQLPQRFPDSRGTA